MLSVTSSIKKFAYFYVPSNMQQWEKGNIRAKRGTGRNHPDIHTTGGTLRFSCERTKGELNLGADEG